MHAVSLLHQDTDGIFGNSYSTVSMVSMVAVLLNCT